MRGLTFLIILFKAATGSQTHLPLQDNVTSLGEITFSTYFSSVPPWILILSSSYSFSRRLIPWKVLPLFFVSNGLSVTL